MMKLNEASKLNPGKNAIKASLLGSKSASVLVKTASAALKKWPTLDKATKKSVYDKLAELKKVAKENMRNETSKVKPEQKKAATEKATQMYASFVAAVKKRAKAEDAEDQTPDVSALEKQRDELKDWFSTAEEELNNAVKGKTDDEAEAIADKFMADAEKKANQYNEILAKIEDANKSNEALAYLNEWFDLLLEFDADAAAERIKDAAEEIVSGGGDSDSGDEEDSLRERIQEIDNEIEELKERKDDLNQEKSVVREQIADMKEEGAEEEDIADYKEELESLNKQSSEISSEIFQLQKQMEELEEDLKKLQESVNSSRILNFTQFVNERLNR